jgi:hypothetical protein
MTSILKTVGIYVASAYVSSCAIKYTYSYITSSTKDYMWNSVTGDTQNTTPSITEALFLAESPSTEYKAFLQFMVQYGKTYASSEDHGSKFEVFTQNYQKVLEHNQKFSNMKMGIN